MSAKRMLATGVVGTLVAAVCCGTPVLALVLGALGLSAWLAYADYVILPALVAFVALTGYALYRKSRRHERSRL
jgi:mercuric ion transport protein